MKRGVYIHYAILSNLKKYYATNKLLFIAYPLIIVLFLLLETKRVLLHDLGVGQGSDDTGIAEKKQIFRIELVDIYLNISDPLAGLYKSRKDMENYRKLKTTRSKLLKARPEKLLQDTDALLKCCSENTEDCTEAGITTTKISNLGAARLNFDTYANLPNTTKKLKTGLTSKINVIDIDVADILTNQLDGAMKAIIDDEPQAYSDYTLIVEPIREGAHSHNNIVAKAPVSITAVHDLTGDLLAEIPFKFSGIRGTFKTNAEGNLIANLPLGAYLGKVAFIDFVPQSFSFTLTAEGYMLTIRMVPVGV